MANTDTTVALAGLFNSPSLNRKQQKAIEVYGKWAVVNSTTTAPSAADFATALAATNACIQPNSPIQISAVDTAIWAGLSFVVPSVTSVSTLLNNAKLFYAQDDETLERMGLYLMGKQLTILT